jgi:hypothetical protein
VYGRRTTTTKEAGMSARFEMADDWEKQVVAAATPGIERKWWEFCARMCGKSPDDVRSALHAEWGMSPSDKLVDMLVRGDRVEPRVQR